MLIRISHKQQSLRFGARSESSRTRIRATVPGARLRAPRMRAADQRSGTQVCRRRTPPCARMRGNRGPLRNHRVQDPEPIHNERSRLRRGVRCALAPDTRCSHRGYTTPFGHAEKWFRTQIHAGPRAMLWKIVCGTPSSRARPRLSVRNATASTPPAQLDAPLLVHTRQPGSLYPEKREPWSDGG